jgi:hypothetical protein
MSTDTAVMPESPDYLLSERIWLIDSASGLYKGRDIAEFITYHWTGTRESGDQQAIDICLNGPDQDGYDEACQDMLDSVVLVGTDGTRYRVEEDECVFLVPLDGEDCDDVC